MPKKVQGKPDTMRPAFLTVALAAVVAASVTGSVLNITFRTASLSRVGRQEWIQSSQVAEVDLSKVGQW